MELEYASYLTRVYRMHVHIRVRVCMEARDQPQPSTLLFQQFFTLVGGLIVYVYRSENNFQKLVPSFCVGHKLS